LTSVTFAAGVAPACLSQSPGGDGDVDGAAVDVVVAVGAVVALSVGEAVGPGDVAPVGVGEALVVAGPVQVTPLSEKLVGAGLLEPFHTPLNPNEAVPFVAIAPFHDGLVTVTALPLWVTEAFQACVTVCPAA
jgi:hypothetical protein